MKKVWLAYSDLYNAGDLMNIDIVEKVGKCKVKRSKTIPADMTAIGGQLYGLQYSNKKIERIIQKIVGLICDRKPIYIWGSGFWHERNENNLCRKNIVICALRGKKTQEKLEKLTGKQYNVPLADAGLLIDQLIDVPKENTKQYSIGLIPHMFQQEEKRIKELMERPDVHLINIKQTPQEVAQEILSCETILSSSLHGLIFSDSLHIPNLHIKGERELPEGNFKFEDYYSSYGLSDQVFDYNLQVPDAELIKKAYQIETHIVEEKKQQLLECFPNIMR